MAIRNILQFGDPLLEKKSRQVTVIDERVLALLDDMKDTLADAKGAGLAAPQVGVLKRIAIIDVGDGPIELINPEFVQTEGTQDGLEGCLSLPGKWGYVERPLYVKVRAMNRDGEWFETEGEGLAARALCHELEHLDGVLYTAHTDELFNAEDLELESEES